MDKINKFLKRNHVISLAELVSIVGHKTGVYRLVEKGVISKVYPDGLGYFSLTETEEGTAHFVIIAKYYPQCIISGRTALALYDLSLDYIGKIDVDIPKNQNLKNELLNVHRIVESKIVDVFERDFKDKSIPFKIKIYSPERTLFEAYKYFRGSDAFFYAIKQYKKLYLNNEYPAKQYDKILKFNKKQGQEIINLLQIGDQY